VNLAVVTPEQIAPAPEAGASDKEIHDTVLIAASFCMLNRYVDGLGAWAPQGRQFQIDFTEARLALKLDPSGGLLKMFIDQ
jgi:hypothetical protein